MAVGVRSAVLEVAAVLEALAVFEIVGMCLFLFFGGVMVVVVCFCLFCDISVCFCLVFSKIAFFLFLIKKTNFWLFCEISGVFFVIVFCLSACTSDHLL